MLVEKRQGDPLQIRPALTMCYLWRSILYTEPLPIALQKENSFSERKWKANKETRRKLYKNLRLRDFFERP